MLKASTRPFHSPKSQSVTTNPSSQVAGGRLRLEKGGVMFFVVDETVRIVHCYAALKVRRIVERRPELARGGLHLPFKREIQPQCACPPTLQRGCSHLPKQPFDRTYSRQLGMSYAPGPGSSLLVPSSPHSRPQTHIKTSSFERALAANKVLPGPLRYSVADVGRADWSPATSGQQATAFVVCSERDQNQAKRGRPGGPWWCTQPQRGLGQP